MSGSVLTAQSLEPTSDFVSPSLSCPLFMLSLSLSKINKHFFKKRKKFIHGNVFFFHLYLLLRESECKGGGTETGTQNPKQAPGSVSTEPDMGIKLMNCEFMN